MKGFGTFEIASGESRSEHSTGMSMTLAAGVLFSLFGLLTWHLLFFWKVNPQYSYGWLVPGLAIYLFVRRWNSRPGVESAPRCSWPALILCLMVLAPIWLVREATPDWSVVTWLLSLTIALALSLVVCRCGGTPWLIHFAFPVCFVLSAVPWPQRIEVDVVQTLMRFVAEAASEILNWTGIPALATGNLIRLPSSSVAIDEACSGIRSLQAMLMIALFLGEFRNLTIIRRTALVFFALGAAVVLNLVRTTALVFVLARWGAAAFDAWHVSAGHFLLIAGLFLLSGLTFLLTPTPKRPNSSELRESCNWNARPLPPIASVTILLWVAAILGGTELWYGSNEKKLPHTSLEIIWPEALPSYQELGVPETVRESLLCSTGRRASWRDGCMWSLSAFRWEPGRTATQSARVHRPDTCFQASGAVLDRELEPVTVTIGQTNVTFRSYLFEVSERPLFVFFTIWEEANLSDKSPSLQQNWDGWSRVQRAFTRQRNLGQQSLEFVLFGPDNYADVVPIFKNRLPGFIRCRGVE